MFENILIGLFGLLMGELSRHYS